MDDPIEEGEDALTVFNLQETFRPSKSTPLPDLIPLNEPTVSIDTEVATVTIEMNRTAVSSENRTPFPSFPTVSEEMKSHTVPGAGTVPKETATSEETAMTTASDKREIVPDEEPHYVFSREEVVALREVHKTLSSPSFVYFDVDAFKIFAKVENEDIYSRDDMMQLRKLKKYTWEYNSLPNICGLPWINRCFPEPGKRKKTRVNENEYWLWHNLQTFPIHFEFFPFHLPFFDAESFISAARPDSRIPDYLISEMYQTHLEVRSSKEGIPYEEQVEQERRKQMIKACQKIKRFPLTDKYTAVQYVDLKKNVQTTTSVEDAMGLLRDGYLPPEIKVVVAPQADGKARDEEWVHFELKDLIARNGNAYPFLFYLPSHTDGINELEEIREMREELLELEKRKATVMVQLEQLKERNANVDKEIQRMAQKVPSTATRSAQTTADKSPLATTMDASDYSTDQIRPKRGVDPFSVLRSMPTNYGRKVTGEAEIASRFETLKKRFDQCDKKALVLRTSNLVDKQNPANCRLCDLKMESASTFIQHVICKRHSSQLKAVCADALDFWFDAIAKVTKEPSLSPLALLAHSSRLSNRDPNLHFAANHLQGMLRRCVKKILDGDPELKALFNKAISCPVCVRRVTIDKPANFLAHFVTNGHITAAMKGGGQMHVQVIDFWISALDRATVS